MIGRKLVLLKNGQVLSKGEILFEIPNLEKVRHFTVKNAKKYGHMSLIMMLRFYIRSTNFLKNKYEKTKIKIKNINIKNHPNGESTEKVEASKFLKMISDYKYKIRELKNKIHEEEKNS